MEQTYDVVAAYQAQVNYCNRKELPLFVLEMGVCPNCGNSVFNHGKDSNGWSVEAAGKKLITGCPFCQYSFCE